MDFIFIDYDGTMAQHGFVSEKNKLAMAAVRKLGHKVFLNTGRAVGFLDEGTRDLPLDGYCCGFCYWEYEGEVLHSAVMTKEDVETCLREAQRFRFGSNIQGLDFRVYYQPDREKKLEPFEMNDEMLEEFLASPRASRVVKMSFDCHRSFDDGAKLPEDFRHPGLDLLCMRDFAEGIPAGYDKTMPMRELGKRFGVPPENMLAIGDSMNDIPMLTYAGKRGVVLHAPQALIEAAHPYHSMSPGDGVADILHHFYGVKV